MTHYLLLRFKPGMYTPEIRQLTEKTFSALQTDMEDILSADVFENIVSRETNADIMVRMLLASDAVLNTYLEHPLHREYAEFTAPMIAQRTTFDCADEEGHESV